MMPADAAEIPADDLRIKWPSGSSEEDCNLLKLVQETENKEKRLDEAKEKTNKLEESLRMRASSCCRKC